MKSLKNYLVAGLIGFGSLGLFGNAMGQKRFEKDSALSSRILIYGESDHASTSAKKFVYNSVDSLKEKGYNSFAIEFPKEWNESMQKYFAGSYTNMYSDSIIDFITSQGVAFNLLILAKHFHKKGFNIIPIDTNIEEPITRVNGALFRKNVRDAYMAINIVKILEKDSSAKIICYIGGFHAAETKTPMTAQEVNNNTLFYEEERVISIFPTMAGFLNEAGIDPETIGLIDVNYHRSEENKEMEKFYDKKIVVDDFKLWQDENKDR